MNINKVILILMLLMSGVTSVAQDVITTEAIIDDHKRQRKYYRLRSMIEEMNRELHEQVADTVNGYKEVNISLEKYTKCFDLITLIMQGCYTCMNIAGTATYVAGTVNDINKLLQDFYHECTARGDITTTDIFIYTYGQQLVSDLSGDISSLVSSLGDLVLYVSGKVQCTTANLLFIIDNINKTLDKIREHIKLAHIKLMGYIGARISPFFNAKLFGSKTLFDIATDAFGRWMESTNVLH